MANVDKDLARKFYFSNSSNFNSFKGSKAPQGSIKPAAASAAGDASSIASASRVDISMPSSIVDTTSSVKTRPATVGSADMNAGAGLNAVRTIASSQSRSRAANTSSTVPPADAASAEYFTFLKQQQELHRHHAAIEQTLSQWQQFRRERQSEVQKLRGQASDLLSAVEGSTEWNLRSKYDIQQLIRDSNLALQPTELVDDIPPQIMAVTQLCNHISRIKNSYGNTVQFSPFAVLTDQSVRRLGLLENSLAEGNIDATSIARVADNLIVQLENNCKMKPLEQLVEKHESAVDRLTYEIEQDRKRREAAVADGEVHIAEQLCYSIIEHHEAALQEVLTKTKTLEASIEENVVVTTVCNQYHSRVPIELEKIRTKSAKLKQRCVEDIKKMCALREKVEEVEAATSAKVFKEREIGDQFLAENAKKVSVIYAKMEELEREAEHLERERHKEIQKRLVEKDKDEHRRAEFARFVHVVDTHLVPLERTIKNMDITEHATIALHEMLDAYFEAINLDLKQRDKLLNDVKLEAHKEHTELFRHMLLELGEITYRKERMMEETDTKIQQAHVQQELLAETFNPNAKRFGDIKKGLLKARDELDADVHDLKSRAAAALAEFQYSQNALVAAGVQFIHPVTEQEHHTIALKAKMIEYKAMIVGHNQDHPMMQDITHLKREVQQTRQDIEQINVDTSGCVAKALPLIHAANKARLK